MSARIDAYLPKFLVNTWFLWFPLWQWFSILLIIPISIGLATLVSRLFTPVLLLLVRRIAKVRVDQHVARLTGPYAHPYLRFGYLVYFITFPFGPHESFLDLCGINPNRYWCDLAMRAVHRYRIQTETEPVGWSCHRKKSQWCNL